MNFQDDIREGDSPRRLPLVSDSRRNEEHVACTRDFVLRVSDCGPSPFPGFSELFLYQLQTRLQDRTAVAYN